VAPGSIKSNRWSGLNNGVPASVPVRMGNMEREFVNDFVMIER
jgi:hypothetical protein